jgi:hypothetical protein
MDFRELMDEGRILVVDLSGIGRDAAQFIGALIVTGLDLAAHARAGKPASERPPFLLVADEFHSYLTRSFVSLLSEGRKFGICAALAHQHAAQLDPEVRAAILGQRRHARRLQRSRPTTPRRSRPSLRPSCQSKIWSACVATTWRCGSCRTVRRSGP